MPRILPENDIQSSIWQHGMLYPPLRISTLAEGRDTIRLTCPESSHYNLAFRIYVFPSPRFSSSTFIGRWVPWLDNDALFDEAGTVTEEVDEEICALPVSSNLFYMSQHTKGSNPLTTPILGSSRFPSIKSCLSTNVV